MRNSKAVINAISNTDWYSINKDGKLIMGASDGDTALFKARDVFDVLHNAPAADVVEVVRCKDCEYWECVCGGTTGRCESSRNGLFYEYTDNLDYCSYGERKE